VRTFAKDLAQIKIDEENDKLREALETDKSEVERYVEGLRSNDLSDPKTVWSNMQELPEPVLPEDPSELSALDPAHEVEPLRADGRPRTVIIRQETKAVSQSPTNIEKRWIISFQDDGEFSESWDNPLMGWVSAADPMSANIRLQFDFENAKEAVYFAKKRGWDFVVEEPRLIPGRSDDAQYQDNFLPQAVAWKVRAEGTKCDEWQRKAAGASHYRRPLKYHGDGLVPQYGPNPDAPTANHVDGQYKLR